jgi:hypothetical protein
MFGVEAATGFPSFQETFRIASPVQLFVVHV